MRVRTARVTIYKPNSDSIVAYSFNYPEAKIEFKVSQIDTEKPDACMVKIYGVSKETYGIFKMPKEKDFKNTQTVDIFYGYDNNNELVYSGTVERVIYSFDKGAQTLTILLSQNSSKYYNMIESVSIADKTTIGEALGVVAKTYGYNLFFSPEINKGIEVGRVCITGSVHKALNAILSNKYSYYINSTKIYIYAKNKAITRSVKLHMENGLLNYPTQDSREDKFTIRSRLIPSIECGTIILVPVDDYWYADHDTGVYRKFVVNKYNSHFSNGYGVTEMECDEIAR